MSSRKENVAMNDKTINTEVTMREATPTGRERRFRAGDEILGRYVVESIRWS